jgi:membrane associated rhomboid family serine protease
VYGRGYGSPGTGFGPPFTPPIILQLVIANAIAYFAQMAFPLVFELGAISPRLVWQGFLWQPLTYMWLHGSLMHLAMNMLVLWMFGSPLAMAWGPQRFLRFYLICGVGAGLVIATLPFLTSVIGLGDGGFSTFTVGASGAIYGVVLAYSLTWPDRTVALIFPPVAFRAIWLIPIYVALDFLAPGSANISHVGHLGGLLVGWLYLRRDGGTAAQQLSWAQIKFRFQRWRMRRRLRAVQYQEWEARRRDQDRRFH